MAAYTDLQCDSPEIAEAVLRYLNKQQGEQEETPDITAYINKSTVRVTYGEGANRNEWDMQLMGFRDGITSLANLGRPEPCRECGGSDVHARYCKLNPTQGYHPPVLYSDRKKTGEHSR